MYAEPRIKIYFFLFYSPVIYYYYDSWYDHDCSYTPLECPVILYRTYPNSAAKLFLKRWLLFKSL